MKTSRLTWISAACLLVVCASALSAAEVQRVAIVFEGGHETDPRDGGRPVILVASGLGVPPEVFRETFKGVHPSRNGPPSDEEARKNKAVLMAGLGKYGVTNDWLNTVSNRYRYVKSRGELWTHKEAVANAVVKDGKVVDYEMVEPGFGYSSPPRVTVPGHPEAKAKVELVFGKDLERNGAIGAIKAE